MGNWSPRNCSTCEWNTKGTVNCIECIPNSRVNWQRSHGMRTNLCIGCLDRDCPVCANYLYKNKGTEMTVPGNDDTYIETIEGFAMDETDPNGIDQHAPGAKVDAGKTRWSLLPWKVIEGIAAVMTFGASKYSDGGWKEVPQGIDRYFSALMRHKMKIDAGEYLDPDSGLPHWAHLCCNAVFLGYFYLRENTNKG